MVKPVLLSLLGGVLAVPLAAQSTLGKLPRQVGLADGGRVLKLGRRALVSLDAREFRVVGEPDWRGSDRRWRQMRAGVVAVRTDVTEAGPNVLRVEWLAKSASAAPLTELAARLRFLPEEPTLWVASRTDFHWIPAIKSKPEHIAVDHVFRSPAVLWMAGRAGVAVVPDLDVLKQNRPAPQFLDLQFPDGAAPFLDYGIAGSRPDGHVFYVRDGSAFPSAQPVRFACYVILLSDTTRAALLRKTTDLLWAKFARQYAGRAGPQVVPFSTSARYGYEMALKDLWVQGPDAATGGITLSTYFDKQAQRWGGRQFPRDLWFHSWFNNLRTAWGLAWWGRRTDRQAWSERARDVARLILKAPREHGLFSTIYRPQDASWVSSGQGGGPRVYHLPDNAWTALWLLRFEDQDGNVPSAGEFLTDFAAALVRLQNSDGSIPARVRAGTLAPDPVLDHSASTALPVWFLGEMLQRGHLQGDLKAAAARAVERGVSFLRVHVLPRQRFDDFELYFSCSSKPLNFYDPVSQMYGQNTLSMQWSAEAFRTAYALFNRAEDLSSGRFCLDLLSLYQQVWNPPYLDLYTFGGFGVMNTDGEWNDARQAQFAETFANYYDLTGDPVLLERAVAAARASFALVVMDENRQICPRNYQGTPRQFEVHGASAENYGHGGRNERSYQSGFHWGTGSALTTAAILRARYGDLYVDAARKHAAGIDGVVVESARWGRNSVDLRVRSLDRSEPYTGKVKDAAKGFVLIINGRAAAVEGGTFRWR